MKEMFQIGEVAEMMGISVQTLRYYSKRDLIQPAHINEATGYRYYSADQIHFIDRIRYLQKLGLTLDEIKVILDKNDIGLLVETLDKRKEYFKEQLEDIKNTIDNIEWYKKYFTYLDPSTDKDFADLKEMPQRYMFQLNAWFSASAIVYAWLPPRNCAIKPIPKATARGPPILRPRSHLIPFSIVYVDPPK